jgi:Fic family protein
MFFEFQADALDRAVEELDRWREQLDHQLLARTWQGTLRRDLEAQAVAASTELEGVPVTVDEVRRILAGESPTTVGEHDEALVRGYRDAMEYVMRRADDPHFEWNRELIIGIHDRVLAGRSEDGAGMLRDRPVKVTDRRTGQVLFTPPENQVPVLVDKALKKLKQANWHPTIGSAWLHLATAAIHPFRDGNGRVARVLASLVMYRGGFRNPAFTSLEEWWGSHPSDYYNAFHCLGTHFDPSRDVTEFITTHVQAQLSQIRALDLRERTQRGLWTLVENLLVDRNLPERMAHALWEAFFGRPVTATYYQGMTDVSSATATNDLGVLTAIGFLIPHGRTRGRQYLPTPGLMRIILKELGLTEYADIDSTRAAIVSELAQRVSENA